MTVVFSMYKFNLDIVLNARQILTGEQRCESISALMKWVPLAASKSSVGVIIATAQPVTTTLVRKQKQDAGLSRHEISRLAVSMSARMFGGEQGRRVIRTPMALLTAPATAASGGMMGASPTPRTPYGC